MNITDRRQTDRQITLTKDKKIERGFKHKAQLTTIY